MVREKRSESQRRRRKGLSRTTDWVGYRTRGETNDELRRLGAPRSKMPQIKTQALLTVVKGNESNNKVVCKRFVNTMRSDSENTIIDNFLRSGIEIARDPLPA